MPKVRTERKSYRRSPGRQYGYHYDPLGNQNEQNYREQDEYVSADDEEGTRSGISLSRRPNPRRTRQLLRKSIIASKTRANDDVELREEIGDPEQEDLYTDEIRGADQRYNAGHEQHRSQFAEPHLPTTQELMEAGDQSDAWDYRDVDPDAGYEEGLDEGDGYVEYDVAGPSASRHIPARTSRRVVQPSGSLEPRDAIVEYDPSEDYDDDEYYEEERPRPTRKRKKKRGLSRRGLIAGLGAVAVGGVVAYEVGPRVPQALGEAGANIEHQLQDAFNRGVAQGADAARKELITQLETLEGFTLEGAMTAARLTRVAYDVFVSPVIKFGAAVATDFLTSMLKAFKTARMLLAGVYQDNTTLQAIQKVLETWVAQVSQMPKQLDAITETDLDGAQAYLRALQRKLDEEKAKLNKSNSGNSAPSSQQPSAKPTPRSH